MTLEHGIVLERLATVPVGWVSIAMGFHQIALSDEGSTVPILIPSNLSRSE